MEINGPEPAEYALLQSLFVESDTYCPIEPHYISKLLQQQTDTSPIVDLDDFPDLQSLIIPEPMFSSDHDFHSATTEDVIADSLAVHDHSDVLKLALESTFPNVRFLQAARKLELPMLQSDPKRDMKALARTIAEAKLDGFFCKPNELPLEPVDDRKDEGLGMPAAAVHFHAQLTRGTEPDELDFSEEDLFYVAKSLHDGWDDKDLERLIDQEIGCTIEHVRALTPPLTVPSLSDSDDYEMFVPNAEVCEIDSLSEPASLFREDLERARMNLNNGHNDPQLVDAPVSDFIGVPSDTPSFEIFTLKRKDVGVEVPILPMSDIGISNSQEEQSFRALVGGVPGFNPKSSEGGETELPINEDESDFSEQFSLLVQDKANVMTRRLEQEQIEAIDAVARMQPPVLDFSTPAPDWQGAMQDSPAMFFWISHNHQDQFRSSQWPKNSQEQKDLRWIPFPVSLAKVDVRESVGDSSVLQELFGARGPRTLPTSADYVQQRYSLRLLEQNHDEELLIPDKDEPQSFILRSPEDSVMDLIRKRRTTQVAEGDPSSPTSGVKARRASNCITAAGLVRGGLLLGEDDTNAAGRLLSNYINLRAAKRLKPSTGSSTPAPAPNTTAASYPSASRKTTQNAPKPQKPHAKTQAVYAEAPYPPVEGWQEVQRIVISVALPRCIISALQANIPGIDLVDRDFTRDNKWTWSPGSTKRVEICSPLSYEADIIPSPATGIIITTMLQVRQKMIPGSKAQLSRIRQRLARVAPLYERVIVLVSEGNPMEELAGPLDGADAEAYASFVAFACSLGSSGSSVRIIYVAGGSQTLAHWTCALVATYAKEASSNVQKVIRSEETEWEVFLRWAGFNMYAAQVALAVVNGTYSGNGQDRTLVRLLQMSPAERANLLRDFLGAQQNLVDRVSARLG
ncbi:uncharacterized protein ColSpa_05354 [Colletotrichum spaethianum]|uniref:Uncharacterized protein n=1 Tax=Colletotrichum spaethianum TaxID=700344 RepID=A0AA37P1Q0_9PEZI|nr:uncharacterized protein ColSpa_05354 [Colletotrichum spaethianum]GKT45173.1 hypothetical protein ColSpa_05354 [Colletotrichum spaethianum]